tara:strand:+ start:357 stop:566 length:210 start_codon:yes stop_codon:yes gene_type:complete
MWQQYQKQQGKKTLGHDGHSWKNGQQGRGTTMKGSMQATNMLPLRQTCYVINTRLVWFAFYTHMKTVPI